jgi:hypothetical protein
VGDSFSRANVIVMNPVYAQEIGAAVSPFRPNLINVI